MLVHSQLVLQDGARKLLEHRPSRRGPTDGERSVVTTGMRSVPGTHGELIQVSDADLDAARSTEDVAHIASQTAACEAQLQGLQELTSRLDEALAAVQSEQHVAATALEAVQSEQQSPSRTAKPACFDQIEQGCLALAEATATLSSETAALKCESAADDAALMAAASAAHAARARALELRAWAVKAVAEREEQREVLAARMVNVMRADAMTREAQRLAAAYALERDAMHMQLEHHLDLRQQQAADRRRHAKIRRTQQQRVVSCGGAPRPSRPVHEAPHV